MKGYTPPQDTSCICPCPWAWAPLRLCSLSILKTQHAPAPDLVPTDFNWEKDEATKSLLPITWAEGVALPPLDVIKLIRCGCGTDQPCTNASCMCGTAQMSCTIFCGGHGMEEYCNRWTKKDSTTEEDGDSDADDVDLRDD